MKRHLFLSAAISGLMVISALTAGAQTSSKLAEKTSNYNEQIRVKELIKKLQAADFNVQRRAIRDLGRLGPAAKDAVRPLLQLRFQRKKSECIRCWLLWALPRIGEPAVPALVEIAGSCKDPYRHYAVYMLRRIAQKHGGAAAKVAVPALTKLIGDTETGRSAVRALAAIGPEARQALPALRAAYTNARNDDYRQLLLNAGHGIALH